MGVLEIGKALVEAASQGPEKESAFVAEYYDDNIVSIEGGGDSGDQFVVQFTMDLTPNGGERMQMVEVGLYTVVNNKIAQEEYLYLN